MARQKRQSNQEERNTEIKQTNNIDSNETQTAKAIDKKVPKSAPNDAKRAVKGASNKKIMTERIEQKIFLHCGNRTIGENGRLLDQIIRRLQFEYMVPKSDIESRINEIKALNIHSISPIIEECIANDESTFRWLSFTLFGNVTDILAAVIYQKFFAAQSS